MRSVLVFVGVAVARIADAGVDLAWHAPAGCPDETTMRAAIVQHLDAPPEQIVLAVSIEVAEASDGFVAHITTGDETRELTSKSCSELADAVAVIVARTATRAPVVAPPPPPPPAPKVAPPAIRTVVASPAPAAALSPWNAGLRVSALAGSGFSPEAGMAGEVAAWASYRDFSAELAAERWWATTAPVGSTTGVEVGLTVVALRLGWAPMTHLRTWIVGELGSQHGMGIGFADAGSGSGRRLAAGGGVGLVWPLAPHLAAVAAGELEATLEHTTFAVGMGATVYEAPLLAERVRLGLELSWR